MKTARTTADLLNINDNTEVSVPMKVLKHYAGTIIAQTCQKMKTDIAKGETGALLTIDEVAAMLRVTRRTLERWDNSGYLQKVHVGRKPMYRSKDILKIINQNDKK